MVLASGSQIQHMQIIVETQTSQPQIPQLQPQTSRTLTLPTPPSFSFPYAQPYPIQTALMQHVYSAVEDPGVRVAVVESPTGTVSSSQ